MDGLGPTATRVGFGIRVPDSPERLHVTTCPFPGITRSSGLKHVGTAETPGYYYSSRARAARTPSSSGCREKFVLSLIGSALWHITGSMCI
jgi:hypothetical protein